MTTSWRSDLRRAQAAAAAGDTRGFTAALPAIIHTKDTGAAAALVTQFGADAPLLAEHLMLLGVDGLMPAQLRGMLSAIVPAADTLPDDMAAAAAHICARMGAYGFSFPLWRFLTQRIDAPALLEQYGFTRIERPTDVRDPSLPRHDPARDLFGMGFVRQDGAYSVEYRRAYIMCICHRPDDAAALIIRNSSYFFGRDRLPAPVYVAWGDVPADEANALDENSFSGGHFMPWPQALAADGIGIAEKLRRMSQLLGRLDAEEQLISRWLCQGGAEALCSFMQRAAPFYMGLVRVGQPPWFPHAAAPATPDHLRRLGAQKADDDKIALLSGVDGDFPAPPIGRGA